MLKYKYSVVLQMCVCSYNVISCLAFNKDNVAVSRSPVGKPILNKDKGDRAVCVILPRDTT